MPNNSPQRTAGAERGPEVLRPPMYTDPTMAHSDYITPYTLQSEVTQHELIVLSGRLWDSTGFTVS